MSDLTNCLDEILTDENGNKIDPTCGIEKLLTLLVNREPVSLGYLPKLWDFGAITIETTSDDPLYVPLDPDHIYVLYTSEITISTGAIYGSREYYIMTSINPTTDAWVISRVGVKSNGSSGITIADIKETDRFGISLKPNAVGRKVIYSVLDLTPW